MTPNPPSRRTLTIVACVTVALISTVPEILWIELFRQGPGWGFLGAKLGLLLCLFVASFLGQTLRPLRNFFLVMFAFFGLSFLRGRINFNWPALQSLLGASAFDVRMQAEQTGKLVVSIATIALLLLLGYKRRDFFLTPGLLRAPIRPVPWLGFPKPDPWPWFGLQWALYIAAALAVMLYFSLRLPGDLMLKVLPVLPSILFYAALNAFNEEMTYRAPMLATLGPGIGSQPALWLSASFFGIAHYFGTPGGLVGGIASVFMGWILAKAMLETRGLFWAWWIHFLSDIVIFTFLTAAMLK